MIETDLTSIRVLVAFDSLDLSSADGAPCGRPPGGKADG
jgi:hypothetical protein